MYLVKKTIEVSYAHRLALPYESGCTQLHGHNGVITVCCCAEELNAEGMVVDFHHIKDLIKQHFDHTCINDHFSFNPTAENMARWICDNVPQCFRVSFQESEGNTATYIKPGYEHLAV